MSQRQKTISDFFYRRSDPDVRHDDGYSLSLNCVLVTRAMCCNKYPIEYCNSSGGPSSASHTEVATGDFDYWLPDLPSPAYLGPGAALVEGRPVYFTSECCTV